MSYTTATNQECMAVSAVAGTAITNSASAGVLNSTSGAAYCPVNFFKHQLYAGILVTAKGTYSSPGAGPATMQIGATLDAAQGTTGALTFLSGAITPVVSASSWLWELEVLLAVQSLTETSGAGTSNIVGLGHLTLHGAALGGAQSLATNTVQAWTVPVGATATVNQSTVAAVWVEIYGKFGSAVSGSTMQCQQSAIYGIN
jgi:hypothetical protein